MIRRELIFVIKNDIGVLIGADSIPVTSVSVLEVEIRDLWEAIYWATDNPPGQHIVVEGDVQG